MHAHKHTGMQSRMHARMYTRTHTHTDAHTKPMAHNCSHTQARHAESRGEKTDLRADLNNTWCCDTSVTVYQVSDHCGQHWWRGGLSVVTSVFKCIRCLTIVMIVDNIIVGVWIECCDVCLQVYQVPDHSGQHHSGGEWHTTGGVD